MTAVGADIDAAARQLEAISASLKADGLDSDPGTLLKIGRLRIRLDAAKALTASGRDELVKPFSRGLLLDIARAFPSRTDWRGTGEDEQLHQRHEAIGRDILAGEIAL